MTKEEILAKSRNEKKDEGTEYIASRGRRWGVGAMSLMFIALSVFNWANGQDNDQLLAVFWAYLSFEEYGMYKVNHERMRLIAAILGLVAAVLFAVCYVITVLR